MKNTSTSLISLVIYLYLVSNVIYSQNSSSYNRLTNQNLAITLCDEDADGYMSINVHEIENYVIQTVGVENNYFLEEVLVSSSTGNIYSIYSTSNDPYISTLCNLNGSFSDIAVNSNQQVFVCDDYSIISVDNNCNAFYYDDSSFQNNALSFDDLDNLYTGNGVESRIYRYSSINDTTLSNYELWHDFQMGTSGGDFVLLNNKMYISWRLANDNFRLYEVTVNEDRDYISHIDLGQLPNQTYGLASELGSLYGVTPNKLFKINLTDFTFSDVIQNPNPEDKWFGAAGLHEAIVFDINTYLTLNDAENEVNSIAGTWTNTTPGEETLYIRIKNSATGTDNIVILEITISSYPNVNQPLDLIKCFDNVLDLSEVSSQMQINPDNNLTFTYYNADPESNNVSNPLPLQYSSVTNLETLFVNVENNNGGCNLVYSFQVITNENPLLLPLSNMQSPLILESCYFDENSNGYFNLNDIENDIILSEDNFETTFYLSHLDAENGTNEISNIYYLQSPTQEVFIKVATEQGCYTISNFYLDIDCFTNIEILSIVFPKFFTPNGDNLNDFWNIKGATERIKRESTITIFDRYGKVLFSFIPDSIIGWDGTFNGLQLPASDYWFVFKTKSGLEKTGHFTLKR
ncbi:T9SS type B sorting domain-containing protein [uncultured Psychroserpens sp.]|uniref:T9SS type B sorting domain-containing protein n=1 Tax=uncultured Psychroserpens sp. TaxID=255436 RepID=UPI00262D7EA3|nr:T9SS type B sorting domain-containing protein [uncultured Psychroserpens sp.]